MPERVWPPKPGSFDQCACSVLHSGAVRLAGPGPVGRGGPGHGSVGLGCGTHAVWALTVPEHGTGTIVCELLPRKFSASVNAGQWGSGEGDNRARARFKATVPSVSTPLVAKSVKFLHLNICYVLYVLLWIKYWLVWFESILFYFIQI